MPVNTTACEVYHIFNRESAQHSPSTFISSNIPEAFILITQPECPFLLYRAITTLFDASSYRAVNNLLVCHQILHCSGFGLEVSVFIPAYLSTTFRCFFSSQSG